MVLLVILVQLEELELQVVQDLLVELVLLVHLDFLAELVQVDPLDGMDQQELLDSPVELVQLVQRAAQAHLVSQEPPVQLVLLVQVGQEPLEILDRKVNRVLLVPMVELELLDPQVVMDGLEQLEALAGTDRLVPPVLVKQVLQGAVVIPERLDPEVAQVALDLEETQV